MPKTAQFDIEGFVLAGGASRRMGTDKATLLLDGVPLAERAARVLDKVCPKVAIVGSSMNGRRSITDVVNPSKQRASIYGLYTALLSSRSEWTAVLACDLPFVTSDLFHDLLFTASNRKDLPDGAIPLQLDGRPQPLAAVYRSARCLPVLEKAIAGDSLKLSSVLRRLDLEFLKADRNETKRITDWYFLNINTRTDLQTAADISKLCCQDHPVVIDE